MNKNSNEELQLQFSLEKCPEKKITGLDSQPTLKPIIVAGSIALMAVLIQFGHENANGKTTVAATLHGDYLTPSIALTDSQLMADPAKLLPIDLLAENNRSEFLSVPYFSDEIKEESITPLSVGNRLYPCQINVFLRKYL